MRRRYREIVQTAAVEAEQVAAYGQVSRLPRAQDDGSGLGESERSFIAQRDSFYMASVSEDGWPYVQHRGGPPGFLKVLNGRRLAFADYEGNRQLVSMGNLAREERVSLILVDYVARERLKILGRAVPHRGESVARFAGELGFELEGTKRVVEIAVEGFDWNCPKWITQRFTREQVEEVTAPLRDRIAELEAELGRR